MKSNNFCQEVTILNLDVCLFYDIRLGLYTLGHFPFHKKGKLQNQSNNNREGKRIWKSNLN